MIETPRSQINFEKDKITHTDPRTGALVEHTLQELVELAFWLLSREDSLRRLLHSVEPINTASYMHIVGLFWIGETSERQMVRVSLEDFAAEQKRIEETTRRVWADSHNEEIDRRTRFDSEIGLERRVKTYDPLGRELWQEGTPPELQRRDPADCPFQLIYENQQKLGNPAYWVFKQENLDLGKIAKLA